MEEKKNVLEKFQSHLQTLFDWQKELDRLNMKAQMLLETCADTRISNAITQLTTKYNALLSLAKEIMRRLELHYQVCEFKLIFHHTSTIFRPSSHRKIVLNKLGDNQKYLKVHVNLL